MSMPENDARRYLSWEAAVLWLKSRAEHAELVRNCYYDDPLLESAERYYRSGEWKSVQTLLAGKPRGEALDLGAGRGVSSYALAKDGWKVSALEPDASAIVGAEAIRILAKQCGLNISVAQEHGESLPFADGSFDLVHARQVMHHARDLAALCRETFRVLRPGGILLATREHVVSSHRQLRRFLAAHPLHHLYGGEHAYTLSHYKRCLRSAGFDIKEIMNPFQSAINLFPVTPSDLKRRFLLTRLPEKLADWVLGRIGSLVRTPGRLYSFLCRKPNGE